MVCSNPLGIVGNIDYKRPEDNVTYSEAILYNAKLEQKEPVYIAESSDPENGPFRIMRYLGADTATYPFDPCSVELEEIATLAGWAEWERWEASVRREYSNNKRVNGNGHHG